MSPQPPSFLRQIHPLHLTSLHTLTPRLVNVALGPSFLYLDVHTRSLFSQLLYDFFVAFYFHFSAVRRYDGTHRTAQRSSPLVSVRRSNRYTAAPLLPPQHDVRTSTRKEKRRGGRQGRLTHRRKRVSTFRLGFKNRESQPPHSPSRREIFLFSPTRTAHPFPAAPASPSATRSSSSRSLFNTR